MSKKTFPTIIFPRLCKSVDTIFPDETIAPLKCELKFSILIKKILTETYTPVFIIIDDKGDIVYVHGRTSNYLELPYGKVKLHFLSMIRAELKSVLHDSILKISTQQKEICLNRLQLTDHGESRYVNIKITPLQNAGLAEGKFCLITIEKSPAINARDSNVSETRHDKIPAFDDDYGHTTNMLQAKIEELEASNKELKSLNEELQAMTEESQAMNEELQSLNESVSTNNIELQNYIEHLFSAKNESGNLFNHIDTAILFLDRNLCIKNFTPRTTDIINLMLADVGRPVNHFISNIHYQDMAEDARTVLKTLEPIETECLDKHEHCYLIKIKPYLSTSNIVDGVVIAFLKIKEAK